MTATAAQPLEYRPVPRDPGAPLTVALAGNPNCGKTTIFNALTGLRQKVANYPGVTVEKKTGRCKLPATDGAAGDGRPERWVDVIDLPGTYSLVSRSPDEQVAMEVLRGLRPDTRAPDVVVVVVDASNLQRNLYLVSQLIELGRPMVVALNMTDVAERRGTRADPDRLSAELGVPVVPLVGHKRRGVDALKAAIGRAAVAPLPAWPLPDAMREELLLVAGGLAILESEDAQHDSAGVGHPSHDVRHESLPDPKNADRLPGAEGGRQQLAPSRTLNPENASSNSSNDSRTNEARPSRPLDRYEAIAERLLIGDHADDVAPLVGRPSVHALLAGAVRRLTAHGIDPMQADIEAHYRWIDGVAARVTTHTNDALADATGHAGANGDADAAAPTADTATATTADTAATKLANGSAVPLDYPAAKRRTVTDKVDAVLVHKVWGLLIFAAVMGALFVSIFWLADPVMSATEEAVKGLGKWLTAKMGDGPLKSLITDGVFAGVGAVVVFVPQIAMLFFFLAILEDSGYLARAAFLMDRLLGKVGLSGKAFIPLLSSFACAIPGIMAARTIESRRDRLATIFIAPFMSCSARLPVYGLLIGAFFAGYGALVKGGVMLACYALGIVAAVATAWAFKRTFLKGPAQTFILELPSYKLPQASQVARVVWGNTAKFLTKAGTIIFCLSVILWALNYYPRLPEARANEALAKLQLAPVGEPETETGNAVRERVVAATQSEYSIAGRIGHFIEPAIRPLGYDWKMGVGLVSAFAAREVFVGSLGVVYSVGEIEDDDAPLREQILADRYADGRPVWTPLVAVSLLIWFVLAMQCMSTLAIVRRETGGWRWPIGMLVYMNALAYVCCLVVYQAGSRIWGA